MSLASGAAFRRLVANPRSLRLGVCLACVVWSWGYLMAEKIEVTPEMIAAGQEVIACRWIEFALGPDQQSVWVEVLTQVWEAMWEARPKAAAETQEIVS